MNTTSNQNGRDCDAQPDGRDETDNERLDRNWNELLQEMRVIQAGTQIITGFLLAAVFQSRFEDLDQFQFDVYLGLVIASILTTIAGLTPVTLHRHLFGKQAKEQLVRYGARCMKITLFGVAVTVSGIALLIFDFAVGRTWGITMCALVIVTVVFVWVVIPRLVTPRATHNSTHHH